MCKYTLITILLSLIITRTLGASSTSCCTSGSATYTVVFTGLWANNNNYPNYPTNFPHWSPLIGAIHSPAVTVYAYGQYASTQVKSVAENGNAVPLKALLEPMTNNVKQVFVSTGSSLQPTATYSVTVNVDNNFNLLSALTMIAPSPDWCVGVDRVNFCTSSCGFIASKTIDLYLWDAGTKAAATEQYSYTGSLTRVPIYQIKTSNQSASVFYRANGQSLLPYARLQLTRVSQNLLSPRKYSFIA
ncbi:Spondin-1 [Trichoplax sp. H2]|uniref:Spondin domain-containing protein n=1 Tax=Trichoplax adhaerens TaxID=10228 RepID=B3RJW3_TRIAD|nr:hypothetical protein TRIADDRAFT_52699 [Trichoplax adhaerens]EDV29855.1 hypothetical protein TRIADDRAFT_52699 [Trichoplax adhaerens]RDD42963.1 Spondin-1 [Trichoplax sp. H2]|eukprot:XP_002109057.1 hypothetical protein TRIADDRAFT_52699 [Trichoplax adhaerens]